MSALGEMTETEIAMIGTVIGGFFYGIYSAIFYMYIRHQASKELGIDKRNILLYPLCILYILSTVAVTLDVVWPLMSKKISTTLSPSEPILFRLEVADCMLITVNALCDFISQGILIYRCWVIWSRNIRVIIIPSILSFAFLAISLTIIHSLYIARSPPSVQNTALGDILTPTSLGISLTVNAVVTGLIVFRILKVYREVGRTCENRTLCFGGVETKIRATMFIIIESGMAMFTIQLIQVIFVIVPTSEFNNYTLGIYQMFMGLTPTIILLRVSMGLSYHDEQSMVQTAASWHFALYNQNPISETEVIEIAPGQERVDCIRFQQSASNDIEIVTR